MELEIKTFAINERLQEEAAFTYAPLLHIKPHDNVAFIEALRGWFPHQWETASRLVTSERQ